MFVTNLTEYISTEFFSKKPDYIAFASKRNNAAVITMPLVMTQSLHANANFHVISLSKVKNYERKIALVRSFERRMLSAYNKKILAGKNNINKKILCASTGLTTGISLEEMLRVLVKRKIENKFIDRHFKYIPPFLSNIEMLNIDKVEMTSTCNDIVFSDLFRIKVKSTEQVSRASDIRKLDSFSKLEATLMRQYESLF